MQHGNVMMAYQQSEPFFRFVFSGLCTDGCASYQQRQYHTNFMCKQLFTGVLFFSFTPFCFGQITWQNVDSLYQPLPKSVHVYKTESLLDDKPNIAFYVEADLNDKNLNFLADTSFNRRLTPDQFFAKNNEPLLIVNSTFFSFATNQNLNVVINKQKLLSYNVHSSTFKGKDSFLYSHSFSSAIGISKKGRADIAWLFTDSSKRFSYASQKIIPAIIDSNKQLNLSTVLKNPSIKKWKMQTAVGGGPVLLQNGEIKISNNEEMKFAGKAIDDKHPRTAMGYTKEGKLIILVIQGRFPGIAEGATLLQAAQIFKDLGCVEAINLDGGGSSCLLVNGKETIKPSDAAGQRAVPAVFLIRYP